MLGMERINRFEPKKFMPGDKCTVTNDGDLFMEYDARQFIGAECVFLKITKAGLAQVALCEDESKTYSVPLRNIKTEDNGIILRGDI